MNGAVITDTDKEASSAAPGVDGRMARGSALPPVVDPDDHVPVAAPPRRFIHYLALVAISSLAGTAGLAWLTRSGWGDYPLSRIVLLTILAGLASSFPLKISHQYTYTVPDIAYVGAIVLFSPGVPGIIALIAGLGLLGNRSDWWLVRLFNLGQNAAYVTAGAATFAGLRHLGAGGPDIAGLGPATALLGAALVMLLVNTGLVAGAIALFLDRQFWRVWREKLRGDAPVFAVLASIGAVAALLVRDYPLALPILVLPAVFLQVAQRRGADLRSNTHDALAALVEIVELRDPYTAGHSHRVATLARSLAEQIGLTPEETDMIESAARVHDLGKVAIDPAVLLKVGPLTDQEWSEMRQHPVYGADVIARFHGLEQVAALIRHHHERWDGAGYPDGLAGEAIPFGARILAVADAFDAMTSARPYRPAHGFDTALRVLEDGAGRQWDQRVVRVMAAYYRTTQETPVHPNSSVAAPA